MQALKNSVVASAARIASRLRGKRTSWTAAMHGVKYRKDLSIEEDIRREVCEFFGVSAHDLDELERKHGSFASREFQLFLYRCFEGKNETDARLFGAYSDAAFYYSLMLGIGCPRYASIFHYLEYLLDQFAGLGRRPVAVDYGAGVGDVAILLSHYGFDVYLIDFPDKKSEFALWRLKRRGYQGRLLPVTTNDPYPALPNPTDLVVTIEVWEHLRSPLTALRNINAVTTPGKSFLMNTNTRRFDYVPEGDHLAEAIEEGRSSSYEQLYEQTWQLLPVEGPDGRLYVRK